jgi:hypothetical protein
VAGEALLEVAREGDAGDAAILLLLGENGVTDRVGGPGRTVGDQMQIDTGVDLVDHVPEVDALAGIGHRRFGVTGEAEPHLSSIAVLDERRVAAVALRCRRRGSHFRHPAAGDEVEHRIDAVFLLAEVAVDLHGDRIGERGVEVGRKPGSEDVAERARRRVDDRQGTSAVVRRLGRVDLVDVAEEGVADFAATGVLLETGEREADARLLVALGAAGHRLERDAPVVGDRERHRHHTLRIGRDRRVNDVALQPRAGDLGRHRHRRRRRRRRTRRRALRVAVAAPDPDRAADCEHRKEGPQFPGPPLVFRATSFHCGQCPRSG